MAGVMLGASLILSILVFGPEGSPSALAKKVLHGDGLGLIVFAGVGGLCLIGGGEFLNYANLAGSRSGAICAPFVGHRPDTNRSRP